MFLPEERPNIQKGCSERLMNLHLWRYSKLS